jgi:hypothetical protein
MGYAPSNGQPVALSGRVPVKVNLDGGPIFAGDAITLSSVPGVGAKATTTSQTVGVALESMTETGTSTVATIEIFVKPELTFSINDLAPLGDFASLSSSTASTTVHTAFLDSFFANLFNRVTVWLSDATNGISDIFANTFQAKEKICVDGECLTKNDIHNLLQLANGASAPITGGGTTPPPANTGTSTPEATPSPINTSTSTPATTPPPIDTSTSTPEATPSSTGATLPPADTVTVPPTTPIAPADTTGSTNSLQAASADTTTAVATP